MPVRAPVTALRAETMVLLWRDGVEMFRVHAGVFAAFVIDLPAVRYCPLRELICDPVRSCCLSEPLE